MERFKYFNNGFKVMDEKFQKLSDSMYILIGYLRSIKEGKSFLESRVESPMLGVSCILPGYQYFPLNKADAKPLEDYYKGDTYYSITFKMKPSNKSIITIRIDGSIADILSGGEFAMDMVKENPITHKQEAHKKESPFHLRDMEGPIKFLDDFFTTQIRKEPS